MFDYDLINDKLASYLEGATLEEFEFIKTLNDIILKNPIKQKNQKYDEKIDINYSASLVYSFFKSLNEEYASHFEKRLNDGTFIIDEALEIGQSYYNNDINKPIIEIPFTKTIEDSFVMVHELLHDINLNPENNSTHRLLFTETISMLGELLFKDFLVRNSLCMKDSYKEIINTTISVNEMAISNSFDLEMVKLYISNGYVSISDLKELYYQYGEDTSYYVMEYLMGSGSLSIDYNQRYIIGELLSCYMYDRIKNNSKYICELMDTNSIMNDVFFDEIINYLDLDMKDDEYLFLTDSSLEKLEKCYQKKLKVLFR